ncbi:MAG: helix-turn-helix domain-containing protein [Pikeienuella sp.]
MTDTQNAKATDRLLIVFEAIAQNGPITLADLAELTGLPRSAAHRAAQVLQRRDWIRARLSDHAYELSGAFDIMMSNAAFASEEGEALAPLMAEMAGKTMHADLGVFRSLGAFHVVESTDKSLPLGLRSLVNSKLSLLAQSVLGPEARVRHLDAFMPTASPEEQEVVTSGKHFKRLLALGTTPYILVPLQRAVIAGFISPGGVAGALRLRLRGGGIDFSMRTGPQLRTALDERGFIVPSLSQNGPATAAQGDQRARTIN